VSFFKFNIEKMTHAFNTLRPLLLLLVLFSAGSLSAQTYLDLYTGTSSQDQYASGMALRTQLSPRFQAGIEFQSSSARYRFIEARPIREGYSMSVLLPMSLTIQDGEKLRLDLYGRGERACRA
jgi:hypothetical protein